jgi:hypothetical protein
VLAIAPTTAAAAELSVSRIAAALRRAGRSRGIDQTAADIKAKLRKSQLRRPLLVETAMGKNAHALLAALDTARANVDELGQASAELFQQHPDYAIITSFPGLADSTGARVLAEIGDDRSRFTDARALKAYAGSAPIARASGRSISVTHRHIKNKPARQRRLDVGLLGCLQLRARPPALPPAAGKRRPPCRRHPPPVQQTFQPASPLPPKPTRPSTRPRHFRFRCATRPSAALQSRTLTTWIGSPCETGNETA